jgi:hypothetical protein
MWVGRGEVACMIKSGEGEGDLKLGMVERERKGKE